MACTPAALPILHARPHGSHALLQVAAGRDPFELCQRGVRAAARLSGARRQGDMAAAHGMVAAQELHAMVGPQLEGTANWCMPCPCAAPEAPTTPAAWLQARHCHGPRRRCPHLWTSLGGAPGTHSIQWCLRPASPKASSPCRCCCCCPLRGAPALPWPVCILIRRSVQCCCASQPPPSGRPKRCPPAAAYAPQAGGTPPRLLIIDDGWQVRWCGSPGLAAIGACERGLPHGTVGMPVSCRTCPCMRMPSNSGHRGGPAIPPDR